MKPLEIMLNSAYLSIEIIHSWSKLAVPDEVIWSKSTEALETELIVKGKMFYEIELGTNAPDALGISWCELTQTAGVYYFSSYILFALAHAQTLGQSGGGDEAFLTLQGIIEGNHFGRSNMGLCEVITMQHPDILVSTRKAVELICDCPQDIFNFIDFDCSAVKDYWLK